MWSILIVEDEVHVRKSLIKNINWNESGFEVIGEASNGMNALAFIKEHQPDLVICDIVMPMMNGIELLKQTKEAGLSCLFVMLTCMNEFDYAQLALQHGAVDYILKLSMNAESLREVLRKVDQQLQRIAGQKSLRLYVEYQQFYADMWDRITDVIREESEPADSREADILPYVAVCSVLNGASRFSIEDFKALGWGDWDAHVVIHQFATMGQTTLFFWSRKAMDVQPPHHVGETPYPVVLCASVPSGHLLDAWRSTLRKLDEFWYSGQNGFHYFERKGSIEGNVHSLSWKIERKFIHYFEQGKVDECEALLGEIWDRMEQGVFPMHAVKHTANRLDKLMSRIADYSGAEPDVLSECTSHGELLAKLTARMRDGVRNGKKVSRTVTDHSEINKILDYIHEHYNTNITLKSLAQFVALEEHYLSSLFKKKTGVNFIDYLHRLRIEKAKHFIDHSDLTVNEVGGRVGFVNDNYFIKIFKRYTNMTPNMYRNAGGKKNT
ncbi:response regulator [Paenibacillus sp. GCM10027626]|uniref:response regulator n=1 Tax=Paenibacillus sp. GCM10027626 TaxID=3273411 RepID=UPI00363A1EEB